MTGRMSDAELLDQTAEWLSRLAETIERVTERLADSISKLQADQVRQGDEIRRLSERLDFMDRTRERAARVASQAAKPRPNE